MGWGWCGRADFLWCVTLCSWVWKLSSKCIWHSDKLHLPHRPAGEKASPLSSHATIVGQKPPTVSDWSYFVLRECFSRLGDHYEPTWNNILQKEWHRRKPEAVHSVHLKFKPLWYGFPSCANIRSLFLFFSSSPQTKALPEDKKSLLCSSDSLWMSVGGFHTNKKLHNKPKMTARLFPKCHVSLNKSQWWFSLWWLLIAAEKKNTALECICILICHQLATPFRNKWKESLIPRSLCFISFYMSPWAY